MAEAFRPVVNKSSPLFQQPEAVPSSPEAMLKEVLRRRNDAAFEIGTILTVWEGTRRETKWLKPTMEDLPPKLPPRGNEPLAWNPLGPVLVQVVFPLPRPPPTDTCIQPRVPGEQTGTHNRDVNQSTDGEEVVRFIHHWDIDPLNTPMDNLLIPDTPMADDADDTPGEHDPALVFTAELVQENSDPRIDEHF
jgi:hypothetical protein